MIMLFASPKPHGNFTSTDRCKLMAPEQGSHSLSVQVQRRSYRLCFPCTNNVAEYETLLIAKELAIALRICSAVFKGDSQLVIKQMTVDYKATEANLAAYKKKELKQASWFNDVNFFYVPRGKNEEANAMAQLASSLKFPNDTDEQTFVVKYRYLPSGRVRTFDDI